MRGAGGEDPAAGGSIGTTGAKGTIGTNGSIGLISVILLKPNENGRNT